MNIKKCFANNRGDTTINAVFLILVMNMLIAFLLLFVTVQIQCTEIRNHAKISLNNLVPRLSRKILTGPCGRAIGGV